MEGSHQRWWSRRGDKRHFGLWRPGIVEAADHKLHNHILRMSTGKRRPRRHWLLVQRRQTKLPEHFRKVERRRLKQTLITDFWRPTACKPEEPLHHQGGVAAMQARREATFCTSNNPLHIPQKGVGFVHQVYGLFGDDKPLSQLFQTSNRKWTEVAANIGAEYHLWNASEVESLMKQRYPQFWDMYRLVRYPIMRCDICRIAILHTYGGLYSDLDVLPNRSSYEQASLALPRVQVLKKRKSAAMKNELSAKKETTCVKAHTYLEMEVVIGEQGNPVFIRWLEHIQREIECKPYAKKNSFWYQARMRYVYNTTGPRSMARFLRRPENKANVKTMKYLECNHFKLANSLTKTDERFFDIISYESNSYFTKAHEILVPVGPGDIHLPAPLRAKRMCHKDCIQGSKPGLANAA